MSAQPNRICNLAYELACMMPWERRYARSTCVLVGFLSVSQADTTAGVECARDDPRSARYVTRLAVANRVDW